MDDERKAIRRQKVSMSDLQTQVERRHEGQRTTTLDGKLYRIVYEGRGPYIRSDGKGEIAGVGFLGIVPA